MSKKLVTGLLLTVPGMPNMSDTNCNHKPFGGCVKFSTYKGLLTACTTFPKVSKRNSKSKNSELAGSMIAFPPCQFVTQQLLKIGPALQLPSSCQITCWCSWASKLVLILYTMSKVFWFSCKQSSVHT